KFAVVFDHATVLVTDLDVSAQFYTKILHLEQLATPWGPTAPIRFFSLGGKRQLHMGLAEGRKAPDNYIHLAFAVEEFDAFLQFLAREGVAITDFSGRSSGPQVRPD